MHGIQSVHTHSQRLERWLGAETVEQLSQSMRKFYWPVALHGVPGAVYAMPGGDFTGKIDAGEEVSAIERARETVRRIERQRRAHSALMRTPMLRRQLHMAGFSSLSDLISEASSGKLRTWNFSKSGPTGVTNVVSSLWGLGSFPPAGADGSAAPGGRALTDANTGAFPFDNVSTDTRHIVFAGITASVAPNSLMLYDRIFDVAKTMNSTATESVTGVPTRYQSNTATNADYVGGSFCFVEVGGTALAATAHNWTVCQYRNQAGTDSQSFPSMTGNSAAIVRRLDHPAGSWFMPLNGSDIGVQDLAQMQCSAAVATGVINFVIGHPIALMPCPAANLVCFCDYINTAFNLQRIFDDAALSFLEMPKVSATATTYSGYINAAHG